MTARTPRSLIPFALLLAASVGCGGIGLPGGGGGTTTPPDAEQLISGEVAWVDPDDRELEVQHRTGRVVARFDANTRVYYQGREYRPENLEPGDVVRMEIVGSGYQNVYARQIDVVESVRSRDDRYDPDDVYSDRSLSGEVERVDTSRREVLIETSTGDRMVAYDDRTRVLYRGQEYQPENLERGDVVRVEVLDGRDRVPYADTIEVTQALQDRQAGTDPSDRSDAERITGTVEWIDERRGEFGLLTDRRETVTVEVPFDAGTSVRDRFARLDRGDYVRIEADVLDRERVELLRFL